MNEFATKFACTVTLPPVSVTFVLVRLAFPNAAFLSAAKLGVLVASGGAAVLALVGGRVLLPSNPAFGAATTADEAERSTEV